MASVLAFDTLAYARRLKEAGVDDAQAEAHAEAVRDAVTEGVATKADLETSIAGLRADLKAGVMHLEGRIEGLEGKIESCATKADVFKVALGAVVAQTTLTVALTVALIESIGGAS